jgi:U3 small nucleolar RNA-associated protein 7
MDYNKHNGIVTLGHTNGVASFWSPTMAEPCATVFVHPSPVTALAVNQGGNKLATAGCDGSVRVWDIRNFDRLYSRTNDNYPAACVAWSATGVLGTARGHRLEFFKGIDDKKPFLSHNFDTNIKSLKFILFDDFTICGLEQGVASVVVPGSGEPNLDSNVANPFATAEWRQEQEVRGLLDKIPWDMITMDVGGPIKVGKPSDHRREKIEKLERRKMVRVPEKEKGKKEGLEKRLQRMKEEYNRRKIEEKMADLEEQKNKEGEEEEVKGPLQRFVKAKKRFGK